MPRIAVNDVIPVSERDSAEIREKRHKYMLSRQIVIFGWIILIMIATVVVSIPFATGLVALPFGNTFSLSEEAKVKMPPCAPAGKPVALSDIEVSVFNGSSRNGLARETADSLKSFGVNVNTVGNASSFYSGSARLTTGKEGVVKAYSLARALPDSEIYIDLKRGSDVQVLLGEQFQGALSKDNVSDSGLGGYPKSPKHCWKMD